MTPHEQMLLEALRVQQQLTADIMHVLFLQIRYLQELCDNGGDDDGPCPVQEQPDLKDKMKIIPPEPDLFKRGYQ